MQKTWEMTETLAYGYSPESTQRDVSNEYQHDRVLHVFQKYLGPCASDKHSLSIGRVKGRKMKEFLGRNWLLHRLQQLMSYFDDIETQKQEPGRNTLPFTTSSKGFFSCRSTVDSPPLGNQVS